MIALAKPARLRHVLIMLLCTPFLGVFFWVGLDVASDSSAAELAALLFLLSWALFPFTRNLQALFLRPYFLANETEIALRHWDGGWSLLLPFYMVREDRIKWADILGIGRKLTRANFIFTVDNYVILQRKNEKEVHIHGGVFNLTVPRIIDLVERRIAIDIASDAFEADQGPARTQHLAAQFAMPLELKYAPRPFRLLGLCVGPFGLLGGQWLYKNLGDNTVLDYVIAFGSAAAVGWLIFAIDEAVRSIRHRNRNFWFRSDGIATGANEATAEIHAWHNVLGAHRRVKQMRDQWDKPRPPYLDGLDILLRDGRALWIPEEYKTDLDELYDVLQFEGQLVHPVEADD